MISTASLRLVIHIFRHEIVWAETFNLKLSIEEPDVKERSSVRHDIKA